MLATGTLTITNQRQVPVTVQAKLQVNGLFQAQDKKAMTRTIETNQGIGLNPTTTAKWEIIVEGGDTKQIPYTFTFSVEDYNYG